MNNKISIIIPFYNTKKEFLKEAIDSAVNQSYNNVEVIVINDGSDESYLSFLQQYKNIKLININNSGVSKARNVGINNAKGDYVMFLDSDDFLTLNACEKLNDIINKNDKIDIIISKTNIYNGNNITQNYSYFDNDMVVENKEDLIDSIFTSTDTKYSCVDTPWAKLYKRSFLFNNNIHFNEVLKNGEDGIFNFESYLKAQSIYFTPQLLYNYRINSYSTCSTYHADLDERFSNLILEYKYLLESINNHFYNYKLQIFTLRIFCRLLRKYYKYCENYDEFLTKMKSEYNKTFQQEIKNIKIYDCNFSRKLVLLLCKTNAYYPLYILTKSKVKIK